MSLLRSQPKAVCRAASSVGLCAQSRLVVFRPSIVARMPVVTAAAADTEAAAAGASVAAPVAEPPAADAPPAAAEPAQRRSADAGGRSGRQGREPSSDSKDEQVVRIGADSVPTKVAAYMFNMFKERGSDATLILQAAGAPAYTQALKAMARMQQMLADDPSTADRCVVFKPRGVQVYAERRNGQPAQRINTMHMVVSLAPRSDWPASAFNPEQRSSQPTGSNAAPSGEDSSSKSSKDSAKDRRVRMNATPVRPEVSEEQQRLEKHMMRSCDLEYPAQFSIAGRRDKVASGSAALMYAVDAARQSRMTAQQPSDLCCTVVSQSFTVELPLRSEEQGSEPAAAAAAAAEPAAAQGGAAGSAAAEEGTMTVTRTRIYVTVQASEPNAQDVAAAHKRQQQPKQRKQSRGADGSDSSSRGPLTTRPGYVEVREDEWNQLKEQLQVVPHLTEQLQIMTRQHEQLLSLLAAQQSQQQGSD